MDYPAEALIQQPPIVPIFSFDALCQAAYALVFTSATLPHPVISVPANVFRGILLPMWAVSFLLVVVRCAIHMIYLIRYPQVHRVHAASDTTHMTQELIRCQRHAVGHFVGGPVGASRFAANGALTVTSSGHGPDPEPAPIAQDVADAELRALIFSHALTIPHKPAINLFRFSLERNSP